MNIDAIKINWIGSQYAGHSFSIVNRNICNILQQDHQMDLRKGIPESEKASSRFSTEAGENKDEFSLFSRPDLTVDHQWPPDWSIRKKGRWVCMQPWEYGAIPRKWYIPMKYWVDEIWVNSS